MWFIVQFVANIILVVPLVAFKLVFSHSKFEEIHNLFSQKIGSIDFYQIQGPKQNKLAPPPPISFIEYSIKHTKH